MTEPVFVLVVGYPRWCRLLTIGVSRHVTACRATIDATESVTLTATVPPGDLLCSACGADLEVRRQRATTRDLGPAVIELGTAADLRIDEA